MGGFLHHFNPKSDDRVEVVAENHHRLGLSQRIGWLRKRNGQWKYEPLPGTDWARGLSGPGASNHGDKDPELKVAAMNAGTSRHDVKETWQGGKCIRSQDPTKETAA